MPSTIDNKQWRMSAFRDLEQQWELASRNVFFVACWLHHVQLEVLTGSGQERYPAHDGLWSGLARPRARIPTASGQGSHGLGP